MLFYLSHYCTLYIKKSKQDRIKEIQDDVNELTDQLASLKLRLEQEIESPSETLPEPFIEGDILEITNNYKGLKGTQGKVIYTTAKQCTIRELNSRKTHTRARTNFTLVHHAV